MPQYQIPFKEDCFYHVYNHGIGDINLFEKEKDFQFFMNKYIFYLEKYASTFAYCLMPNHFHFLIRVNPTSAITCEVKSLPVKTTSQVKVNNRNPVSQAFSNLQNSYARHYNIKHDRKGGLFQSRIKRKHVDSPEYLLEAINYIHQNPVSHGFVRNCEEWKYSSYNAIVGNKKTKVEKKSIIEWFADVANFSAYHREKSIEKYSLRMEMEY